MATNQKGVLFLLGGWNVGGVERVTVVLANEFVARGWKVTIVYFLHEDGALLSLLHPDVVVKTLNYPVGSKENQEKLRELFIERDVAFVLNQWCLPYPVTRLLRSASEGLPVRILAVHHNVPNNNGRIASARTCIHRLAWKILSSLSLRCVYKKSDAYIVLSKRFEPIFRAFTRLRHTPKLHTITNPLTVDPAPEVPKEKVLLYVGRLEETQKRVSRIIDVWRILAPKFPDWRLEIVGDGPDRTRYEAQAEGLERITFYGFQAPAPFYAKAQLLLLTSEFEGFPLVLAEAMAAKCVLVVYGSYPAAYDIVRGTNGVVVAPPFNAETFAQVVGDLMASPQTIEAMAQTAKTVADTFAVAPIATQWETLFASLANND